MKAESVSILDEVLDNITSIVEFDGCSYYLLIKKQKSGRHCLFYLTDYSDNFWLNKITEEYLAELRDDLKIKTQPTLFAEHFCFGVKQLCSLKQLEPTPILVIKLKISEGLVINCKLQFENCVNIDENTDQFKAILKVFGKQLYEARDRQTQKALKALEEANEKQQALQRERAQEKTMSYKLLGKPQTKIIPEKYRDLINPLRKKRKGLGMKIGRKYSSSSDDS